MRTERAATIDIDIGGTFTDCVVQRNGTIYRSKAPTTRHDLSQGFMSAIATSCGEMGISIDALLSSTELIRYSTTVAVNALIERKGIKLGLITTRGSDHMMYIGRSRQWADGLHQSEIRDMSKIKRPELLVPLEMTVAVTERLDCFGNVIVPLDEDDVRRKVNELVDQGVRGFVVSTLWSFVNPVHERRIRDIILEEYPESYLGNMPVVISSDVQPKWHEYPRTNVAVLNAYLQTEMTSQLLGLSNELWDRGYKKPLAVVNNIGGMAKLARTKAVDTYGAGPVAGLFGARFIGKLYGFDNIVVSDMGGTSFDFGLITNGKIDTYNRWPVVDRWATESSIIEVKSVGAGGGSIAWLNRTFGDIIEVGPTSAGSNPGPACYGLGGREPTVTDADLILGYLNPDRVLGGSMRLDIDLAKRAVERRIARHLGIEVMEAAANIRSIVSANMGDCIAQEVALRGHDLSQFVLFAYGGAGPVHACDYASHMGAREVLIPGAASEFCAWGATTMNLRHVYERSQHVTLWDSQRKSGALLNDLSQCREVVRELKRVAFKDMTAEGFDSDDIRYSVELDMRYGGQYTFTRVLSPTTEFNNDTDARLILDAFDVKYEQLYSSLTANRDVGVEIESFYLTAEIELPDPSLPRFPILEGNGVDARIGERNVYWLAVKGLLPTSIFDATLIRPGERIEGPAIVEASDTTVAVPPSWILRLDEFLNIRLTKEGD